jgi:hypothetical protein
MNRTKATGLPKPCSSEPELLHPSMAKFDFIESAAIGYRYVWRERYALLPLVSLPIAVKMGSYAAIYLMHLEDNVLRQGLVLMPAYLMEGFIAVLVIRMAMFGERYHNLFKSGEKENYPAEIRRTIMTGVVVYLMTKLVSSFLLGWAMVARAVEGKLAATPMPKPEPGGIEIYVTSIMIMIFLLWTFRFFWLYIPAAMNITARAFLTRIAGFMSSVYMAGLWMMCLVPITVILIVIARLLMTVFPGVEEGVVSPIYGIIMAIIQPVFEMIIVLTSSVGMAHAVRTVMSEPQRPPRSLR